MVSEDELQLFKKEIYLLIDEYDRCLDIKIKNQIYHDIELLLDVIVMR
ncbi:hypothetical protein NC661_16255 [Aquibacillus koreensis]|uniref:Uncharacterized protein n=1 Tax=Aquibacillus koreensis TaxID=279446 RepID=A0A9X4AJL4_9BACI|nr:hypothetical protein [Aquibacillus koreensis]MCT2536940.1 hypothetical protein [Aquibacillus koreensis]MDC3421929.1 hypothetical protein [Aquibacillus koreensis]